MIRSGDTGAYEANDGMVGLKSRETWFFWVN